MKLVGYCDDCENYSFDLRRLGARKYCRLCVENFPEKEGDSPEQADVPEPGDCDG